jgi:hypothetical protein
LATRRASCCNWSIKPPTAQSAQQSTQEFATSIGCGERISGYVLHTVPVALHACFRYPDDVRMAVLETVRCGGDSDSTAAIVGGILGARVGHGSIPDDWLQSLWEWPRSVRWMSALETNWRRSWCRTSRRSHCRFFTLAVLPRNLFLFLLALMHVVRRALPPY